jgi:cytochrome c6
LRRFFSILVLAIALLISGLNFPALAEPLDGKQLFTANCTACHLGGNNVILANKTLRIEALEKYEMNSLEAIETQIKHGKNAMPAFGGRLNDDQIAAIAAYVLEQSAQGW